MASLDEEGDNAIGQKAGGLARFVHGKALGFVDQCLESASGDFQKQTELVLFWIVCELAHACSTGQGYVLRNHQRKRTAATCPHSELSAVVLIAEVGSHMTPGELGGKRSYEEEANEVIPR